MEVEGYASLDETISNAVHSVFRKGKNKTHIVYLYPAGYLKRNYLLIDDYEKSFEKKNHNKAKG